MFHAPCTFGAQQQSSVIGDVANMASRPPPPPRAARRRTETSPGSGHARHSVGRTRHQRLLPHFHLDISTGGMGRSMTWWRAGLGVEQELGHIRPQPARAASSAEAGTGGRPNHR